MNLSKKKQLAVRALGISKDRIIFNTTRLDEIKDAITKQDIKDLVASKAIILKNIKGRKSKEKRKTRLRAGSRRRKIINKKNEYMIMVRKLRKYLQIVRRQAAISEKDYQKFRKEVRARIIRNLAQLKERISEIK